MSTYPNIELSRDSVIILLCIHLRESKIVDNGHCYYLAMFIHESQLRESALMFSKEMSGKLILCMANGVLFKHKKEQIHVTYRKNDETRGYPIE